MFVKTVDAREHKSKDKHRVIFEAFDSLKKGEKMELINDHDPKPLHYQMKAEMQGQFVWEYLEEGPEVWRVAITRNFSNK